MTQHTGKTVDSLGIATSSLARLPFTEPQSRSTHTIWIPTDRPEPAPVIIDHGSAGAV
ncbi:MAG: hypothetical protein ACR2Q4_06435 [Geminicoccaceae bacterium]